MEQINHSEIRREMYILLGLLLADKKISALAERQGSAASRPERVTHGLLLPKLVMVASNVRVVLEDVARQKGVPLKEYCGKQCGTYYKDAQKQESAPMSLRKACSCVMHRTSVDFFADGINFDGKITIDGSPSDTNLPEWRAVINLNNFVAACIAAMEEWRSTQYPAYKYVFEVDGQIVHAGVTGNLGRREQEIQRLRPGWSKGRIKQVD